VIQLMPRIPCPTSRGRHPRSLSPCLALALAATTPAVAQQAPAGAAGTSPAPEAPPPPAPPGLGAPGFRFHGCLRSGVEVDPTGKGQQPFQAWW
jgi:hypothetical protein